MRSYRAARASKACVICRRQKTRCFPSQDTKACLRCASLGIECSFLTDNTLDNSALPHASSLDDTGLERRLGVLESSLGEVLRLVQNGRNRHDRGPRSLHDSLLLNGNYGSSLPQFGFHSTTFITSPFSSLGSLMTPTNYPPPIQRLITPQMVFIQQNIITLGLVTREKAIELLNIFLKYYNQWVSLPTTISTEKLLDLMIGKSSLLLTVCCCIVVRYHDPELRKTVWKLLLHKLQEDLRETMLIVPHTIEFIQALAVMSIYASSLSDEGFVIDAWFISSMALEHFVTKNVLGLVMSFDGVSPVTEMDEITAYRVWNHLCLVHLVNCVMTGRMCILDQIRIDQCRKTLDIATSTNFDGRMIAEINFQLIIYTFQEGSQSLEEVEEEFRLWHNDWGYLFEQPTTQFVETGYHYGYFLILYHWNYRQFVQASDSIEAHSLKSNPSDVARVFDTCDVGHLRRMIRHTLKVIEGLLNVSDATFFIALSDQIHFCGAYAAIMLARLIETVKSARRILDISETLFVKSMDQISALSARFRSVSRSDGDLVAKYANGIEEALLSCKLVPSALI